MRHLIHRPAPGGAPRRLGTACFWTAGRFFVLTMALTLTGFAGQTRAADSLRSVQSFDAIVDPVERSRAIFLEVGKVIQSPRCMNCHPVGTRPTQGEGDHIRPHLPLITRGKDDRGAVALRCTSCHHNQNHEPSGVPGHANWHMAPIEMGWQGRTLGQICVQIKDPARNGGMSLSRLHEHLATDPLVGWGWHPGGNRTPAPGTQAQLGELVDAWIKTGARCPD